jgi:hypothetical protein
MSEAGVRGGDNLSPLAEQIEKARLRIDVLHTVQQENRPARAPAHDVQLDVPDRQSLPNRRCRGIHHCFLAARERIGNGQLAANLLEPANDFRV